MTSSPTGAPLGRVSWISAVTTVTLTELTRRARDRSLIIQGVVGPVVLAVIVSLAFGGAQQIRPNIGIADLDGSELSRSLVDELRAAEGLDIVTIPPDVDATRAVQDEQVRAAVIIPAGFGERVNTAAPTGLEVITDPESQISGSVARSLAATVAADLETRRLAVGANVMVGADPTRAAELAAELAPALQVTPASIEAVDPASYFAPSMALLFLFFTIGTSAKAMLAERANGTLARIRAAPIPAGALLAGKGVATVTVGVVSLVIVWVITSLAVGASWGPAPAVMLVIVATVLAVSALGLVVAALSHTEAQADGYTAVLALAMALLGGNFVAPAAQAGILQSLARLTPNGWTLDALTDLSAGAGIGSVIVPVTVLVTYAAVAAGIGMLVMNRGTR